MEDKKKPEDLGSFAWELLQQSKHQAKLWFIAFLITLAGLVGTNMAWLYVYTLYDYIDQSGDGVNAYNTDIGGDVLNGTENQETE